MHLVFHQSLASRDAPPEEAWMALKGKMLHKNKYVSDRDELMKNHNDLLAEHEQLKKKYELIQEHCKCSMTKKSSKPDKEKPPADSASE